MRKQVDLDVLNVLVSQTCDTLDTFSAYDVTTILRSRLPNHDILHNNIKPLVQGYATNNSLTVSDNGTYKVYSKAKIAPNVSITYDDRDPIENTIKNKMTDMINSFASRKSVTFDPTKNNSVIIQNIVPSKTLLTRMYNLQSEQRLTLGVDLFKNLTSTSGRYLVQRTKNKITIYSENFPISSTGKLRIRPGQRIRTLLPRNINKVNVTVFNDRIEIVPS